MNKITDRIDAVTKISDEYMGTILPPPKSVKLELTARCDFDCFFCASGQRLRNKSDMDIEFYKRLCLELSDAGVKELGVFYLGESFLLDWLPEAIHFAKHEAKFPYVFLTTNGRLATSNRVKDCMETGLDSLKFSYNNADEKQFKEVTRVKESQYQVIKDNIMAAKSVRDDNNYTCGLYASSIMYDGEQQERMQEAVKEILPYVDQHYYLPLYNQGALTTEVSKSRGYIPTAGNQGRIGALRNPVPCWSAFTEGHVTFDGYLSACCFDHSSTWQMGDLNNTPFMEAWNSATFQALRQAHLKQKLAGSPCEKCVAYQ